MSSTNHLAIVCCHSVEDTSNFQKQGCSDVITTVDQGSESHATFWHPTNPICLSFVVYVVIAGVRERENFITRQPPIGEKDCDSDGENSWISEGLPSSSRRRSRGEGRKEGGREREKASASEVDVGVNSAKSEIKVERRRVPE